MAYSLERRAAVLAKMLPPNNMPLGRLAKEEGISVATLAELRAEARAKGQFLPDANAGPEGGTFEDKLAAVIETAPPKEWPEIKCRRQLPLRTPDQRPQTRTEHQSASDMARRNLP